MNKKYKIIIFTLALLISHFSLPTSLMAKLYIDITSPASKKLPIAISEFGGPSGREISNIIKDDLDFTGIFLCLNNNAFLESSAQPFNRKNWTIIGAEAVLKGTVRGDKNLVVTASLYDVQEGRELFKKEYQTEASLLRPIAHTIANDIYKHITGENGVFRSRIAYVARQGDNDSIHFMDWDGQRSSSLGIKGNIILSPRWSKDGSKLIYSSERDRQWGIYLLDLTKMTEKRVFSSKGINISGDFFPDADEFVMSSSIGGNPNIYSFSVSSSRLSRLSTSRGIDVTPSVSPDGNQIAFVSDRDGSPQVFIMSKDGHDARRITFNGSYNTSPSWSPKGDKVVFSGRAGGKNQIFVINPDGSNLTQVTDRGNNEDPSFSPDGRYIVFTSDSEGEKTVFIMRSNGEAKKRITPKGMRAFGPTWSQ